MIDEKKIIEIAKKYEKERQIKLKEFARLFSKTLKKTNEFYDTIKVKDKEETTILGHLFMSDLIEIAKISSITCIEALNAITNNKNEEVTIKFINEVTYNIVNHFRNKSLN